MPNIPQKDTRILKEIPEWNAIDRMWSFDQPYFVIEGKRVDILSTERIEGSKDVKHTLRTDSGKRFEMKMSEIIYQFSLVVKKQVETIKTKQINQQIQLDI